MADRSPPNGTSSSLGDSPAEWPIFICYRQADGHAAAEFLYRAVRHAQLPFTPEGYQEAPLTSIYFDQTAPAVSDWTSIHQPALQRTRTFIFVCSPGAFSRLGKDDWVYRELDWWLENRKGAPVVVTTHGDRWIPKEIQSRWPNAQRSMIAIQDLAKLSDPELHEMQLRLRNRILEGIRDTAVQVLHEEVERERERSRQLTRQRRWLLTLSAGLVLLLSTAAMLTLYAVSQREAAVAGFNSLARQSAQEWFTRANGNYADNPDVLTAFLLTSRALSIAPSDDPNRATYLGRLLALAPLVPAARANFGDITSASISAKSGVVVTQRNEGTLEAWTTGGAHLPELSTQVVINGRPLFDPEVALRSDGKYAAVATQDDDFVRDLRLIVWETQTGHIVIRQSSGLAVSPTFGPHGWLAHLESRKNPITTSRDDVLRVWNLTSPDSPPFRNIPGGISLAPESANAPIVAIDRADGLHFADLDNPVFEYGPFLPGMRLLRSAWLPGDTLLVVAAHDGTEGIYRCTVGGRLPAPDLSGLPVEFGISHCGDVFSSGKIVFQGVIHSVPSDAIYTPCMTDAGLVLEKLRLVEPRTLTQLIELPRFPDNNEWVKRTIPGGAIAVDVDKSAPSFWTVSNRGLLLQWPIVSQIIPNLSQVSLGSSVDFDPWTATSQRGNSVAVAFGGAKGVEVYIWSGNLGKFAGPIVVPFDVPTGLFGDEATDPRVMFDQIAVFGFDPPGQRLLLGSPTKLNVIDIPTSSVITSFEPDGGKLIKDAVSWNRLLVRYIPIRSLNKGWGRPWSAHSSPHFLK
jgi:WD40 repeat protein